MTFKHSFPESTKANGWVPKNSTTDKAIINDSKLLSILRATNLLNPLFNHINFRLIFAIPISPNKKLVKIKNDNPAMIDGKLLLQLLPDLGCMKCMPHLGH